VTDCKSVQVGSIPAHASILLAFKTDKTGLSSGLMHTEKVAFRAIFLFTFPGLQIGTLCAAAKHFHPTWPTNPTWPAI
jgi:hypothetical protein